MKSPADRDRLMDILDAARLLDKASKLRKNDSHGLLSHASEAFVVCRLHEDPLWKPLTKRRRQSMLNCDEALASYRRISEAQEEASRRPHRCGAPKEEAASQSLLPPSARWPHPPSSAAAAVSSVDISPSANARKSSGTEGRRGDAAAEDTHVTHQRDHDHHAAAARRHLPRVSLSRSAARGAADHLDLHASAEQSSGLSIGSPQLHKLPLSQDNVVTSTTHVPERLLNGRSSPVPRLARADSQSPDRSSGRESGGSPFAAANSPRDHTGCLTAPFAQQQQQRAALPDTTSPWLSVTPDDHHGSHMARIECEPTMGPLAAHLQPPLPQHISPHYRQCSSSGVPDLWSKAHNSLFTAPCGPASAALPSLAPQLGGSQPDGVFAAIMLAAASQQMQQQQRLQQQYQQHCEQQQQLQHFQHLFQQQLQMQQFQQQYQQQQYQQLIQQQLQQQQQHHFCQQVQLPQQLHQGAVHLQQHHLPPAPGVPCGLSPAMLQLMRDMQTLSGAPPAGAAADNTRPANFGPVALLPASSNGGGGVQQRM